MPWIPFDAIEANMARTIAAFTDEEIWECVEDSFQRWFHADRSIAGPFCEADPCSREHLTISAERQARDRFLQLAQRSRWTAWETVAGTGVRSEGFSQGRVPRSRWQPSPWRQALAGPAR